jgi:hypothetical protein
METVRIAVQDVASIALDWAMVIGLFATQAFVATGGIQHLMA